MNEKPKTDENGGNRSPLPAPTGSEISKAFNRLLRAEREFARSIDGFYDALANDPTMRNHPRRPVYGGKVMNQHNHAKFCNAMADLRLDMEGDGFLYMDED